MTNGFQTFVDGIRRQFNPSTAHAVPVLDVLRKPRHRVDSWPFLKLGADHLTALRRANYLSLSFLSDEQATRIVVPGRSWSVEDRTEILVPSCAKTMREHDGGWACEAFLNGFPQIPTPFGTTLALLRPGDRIRLEWFEDADTSSMLERSGLHADVLFLECARGDELLVFRLHGEIGTGTTRMIKRI